MSAVLFGVLLAAAALADAPVAAPIATLRGVVIDAIRNCGQRDDGEILVCSRDRGFAERQRLDKIKRPRPPDNGSGVKVQVTAGPTERPATRDPAAPR